MRPILICCLIIIVVSSVTGLSEGKNSEINYRAKYAHNKEYVGNPGHKYPHIHSGKDFIVYSKGRHDHVKFHKNASKASEVLRNEDYSNTENPDAITNILKQIENDYEKKIFY